MTRKIAQKQDEHTKTLNLHDDSIDEDSELQETFTLEINSDEEQPQTGSELASDFTPVKFRSVASERPNFWQGPWPKADNSVSIHN